MSERFSQHNEQQLVEEFFHGKSDGLFVDIGAGDGVTDSNTRALFLAGWSGILVEASRTRFAQLMQTYAKEKRVVLLYAAISDITGPGSFFECNETLNWSSADPDWIRDSGGHFAEIPSFHFSLSILNMPTPEFLSIDTEGFDARIITSMPYDFRPNLVLAETDKPNAKTIIDREMNLRGYSVYATTEGNTFYKL